MEIRIYDFGFTSSWGITPNLTLGGTINPDFSQVEADVAQLDINEQFALFFSEKRPFFLEGADFFETPLNAVHTRAVADPTFGAKLTGKEGKNAIGFFVAEDKQTTLLIPGSQGSSFEFLDRNSKAGVFRYRRDVAGNSTIGALATVREAGDYHNRVAGFDGLWRIKPTDTFRFNVLGSQTEYPTSISDNNFKDYALNSSYRHSTRNWTARANYVDIGEDFRADLGFIPRANYRQAIIGGEFRWWGDREDWYSRITLGGDWDQTEEQNGSLIERELEGVITVSGPMQSFFFTDIGHRTRVFDSITFTQDFIHMYFEFRPIGDLYLNTFVSFADDIDFAETRAGKRLQFTTDLRYNFGRHLRLDLSHEYRDLVSMAEDYFTPISLS